MGKRIKQNWPSLYRRWISFCRLKVFTKKFWVGFAASPFMALFAALLLILIGVTASAVSAHPECAVLISDLFDFGVCEAKNEFGGRISVDQIFLGLIALFAVIFMMREVAVASKGKTANSELLRYVETLPPSNVMNEFSEAWDTLNKYLQWAAEVDSEEAANERVRLCLSLICVIASRFDHPPIKPRYAANVMLFMDASELEADGSSVANIVAESDAVFIGDDGCLDSLEGVLQLRPDLTASTDNNNNFDKDTVSSKNLILPVPKIRFDSESNRRLYLPGAVEALVDGNCIIPDTRGLLRSYFKSDEPEVDGHDFRDIPLNVFEQIDRYFRNDEVGQFARSFVSIRILADGSRIIADVEQPEETEADADNEEPSQSPVVLGVLNIHCDVANRFSHGNSTNSFLRLIDPFVSRLAQQLVERAKVVG